MDLCETMRKLSVLLKDFQALQAFFSWPTFSITSFVMVASMTKQGISPKTVIDVGANTGQFTIAAAKLFPDVQQVYSFEPLSNCFARLQKNVCAVDNVTVYPLALGDREEETIFHVNIHSHSSSFLSLAAIHRSAFPKAQEANTVSVKVSTLDKIFKSVILAPPVLLKLDVQGYEPLVLLGGTETLKHVDYVVLETSFKPMYEGETLFLDIVRLMENRNFRFVRPVDWLSNPKTGEILQMDALFERNLKNS